MPARHEGLYSLPALYELAFSYRDIAHECDFVLDVFQKLQGRAPQSILELACGPGAHAREFLRRGFPVALLDLSAEMVAYARDAIADTGVPVRQGDMIRFAMPERADLVCTMLDSLSYITTNDDLVAHLQSVRRAVADGGVYFVELSHPRDVWVHGEASTQAVWTAERDGVRVTTEWAAAVKPNPISQTDQVLTRLTVTGEQGPASQRIIETWGVQRPWLAQELRALVQLAGGWEFAGWWGDFALDRELGGSDHDWRMLIALVAVAG